MYTGSEVLVGLPGDLFEGFVLPPVLISHPTGRKHRHLKFRTPKTAAWHGCIKWMGQGTEVCHCILRWLKSLKNTIVSDLQFSKEPGLLNGPGVQTRTMLFTERERLAKEIERMAQERGNERSALISILQELQRKYRHVSDYAMQVIAHALDIHPVEVFSVVSFYDFLSVSPKGRFVLQLSDCVAHSNTEKEAVARQLENDLGIAFGSTTHDGAFTLEKTGCIGMCDQGPVLSVNGRVYTQFTADQVGLVLRDCAAEGDVPGHSSREGER